MVRVGLTGELGSGKSTVARMLADHGAIVFSSDEMGRAMMRPGESVYASIVEQFGHGIVRQDGTLDRAALAHIAFDPGHPRIDELNAIVHPAVIREQARRIADIARSHPDSIVVVESALIFSTKHGSAENWRERFDCIVVVTAPDAVKVARFVNRTSQGRAASETERGALELEAQRRVEHQRIRPVSSMVVDVERLFEVSNEGSLSDLEAKIDALWPKLVALRAGAPV
jgi:dephospho-CoA kinase